jgi:hypothetical protein
LLHVILNLLCCTWELRFSVSQRSQTTNYPPESPDPFAARFLEKVNFPASMMPSVNSKLEESICDFFSKTGASTTRTQCDEFTRTTFGGPVEPVAAQGVCSYTVAAANNTIIVQFREPDSPLDTEMLETVQTVYQDFVTPCRFHGTIGSAPALLIYSMDMLPGDNYSNISLSLSDDDLTHQLATVRSLARFVAVDCFSPHIKRRCS